MSVPADTWDVWTSFLAWVFGASVRRLAPDGFSTRYEFRGSIHEEDLSVWIEDALLEADPMRQMDPRF